MPSEEEVNLQRKYYADTAAKYDAMQISEQDEHQFALAILSAMIEYHGIRSVLDVGSGTGRALRYLKSRHPGVRFVGIEPVEALRKVGHAAGLSSDELRDGDVNALQADDGEFDLVCEFAVLHHVPQPSQAVGEMLRVARKAGWLVSLSKRSTHWGYGGLLITCVRAARAITFRQGTGFSIPIPSLTITTKFVRRARASIPSIPSTQLQICAVPLHMLRYSA
jgi:ubiquinone/menaquinone biosynthesis C-methylase UbiE